MSMDEAFDMLQAIDPGRAVDKWGNDGLKSDSLVHACSITLSGLEIEPSENAEENAKIMAHILWLVAIAFEAGRLYEGGIPT